MAHEKNVDLTFIANMMGRIEGKIDGLTIRIDKIEQEQNATNKKLDKLNVEIIGIKGRIRKVEEGMESIARVMIEGSEA